MASPGSFLLISNVCKGADTFPSVTLRFCKLEWVHRKDSAHIKFGFSKLSSQRAPCLYIVWFKLECLGCLGIISCQEFMDPEDALPRH